MGDSVLHPTPWAQVSGVSHRGPSAWAQPLRRIFQDPGSSRATHCQPGTTRLLGARGSGQGSVRSELALGPHQLDSLLVLLELLAQLREIWREGRRGYRARVRRQARWELCPTPRPPLERTTALPLSPHSPLGGRSARPPPSPLCWETVQMLPNGTGP